MDARFTRLAALAAACCGEDVERLRRAAHELLEHEGAAVIREVLRQHHLFQGFPRTLRALRHLHDLLPATDLGVEATTGTGSESLAAGSQLFERLYGPDTPLVHEAVRRLDPLLLRWILDHAYGRVLVRGELSLAERERLAVLWLASTRCWKQWESHVRNSLRIGVKEEELFEDMARVAWLDSETLERARLQIPRIAAAFTGQGSPPTGPTASEPTASS